MDPTFGLVIDFFFDNCGFLYGFQRRKYIFFKRVILLIENKKNTLVLYFFYPRHWICYRMDVSLLAFFRTVEKKKKHFFSQSSENTQVLDENLRQGCSSLLGIKNHQKLLQFSFHIKLSICFSHIFEGFILIVWIWNMVIF